MMESTQKAITDLEYCVERYGKEDSFTFAAYQALRQMKAMQSRLESLEKDAARYRLLRMYSLNSGSWPFVKVTPPAGMVAWSKSRYENVGYTQESLDNMLDDALGLIPHDGARDDFQEWRAQETKKAIDDAMKG